jgi:hypothetical protein
MGLVQGTGSKVSARHIWQEGSKMVLAGAMDNNDLYGQYTKSGTSPLWSIYLKAVRCI